MVTGGRRFTIEVFGLEMLVVGAVESLHRLTDLANNSDPFLAMTDIESYPYPGDSLVAVDRRRRGLMSKDSMVMLTEQDPGLPASATSEYMQVVKAASRILVHVNSFAIHANIHMPADAEVEQFLTVWRGRFVPVTDATATPIHQGSQLVSFRRPFLLINREHISFLGAVEADVAGYAPAVSQIA